MQAKHASPEIPHCAAVVLSTQTSPMQHPSQVSAQGGATHIPASQLPSPQESQASPPVPHALLLSPVWQMPILSQHPSQLSGPQAVPVEHTPSTHPPTSQTAHVSPFAPHEVAEVPVWHMPFASQQPSQVIELQPDVLFGGLFVGASSTHVPSEQICPVSQATQAKPSAPQASLVRPVRQVSPCKHPVHSPVELLGGAIVVLLIGFGVSGTSISGRTSELFSKVAPVSSSPHALARAKKHTNQIAQPCLPNTFFKIGFIINLHAGLERIPENFRLVRCFGACRLKTREFLGN